MIYMVSRRALRVWTVLFIGLVWLGPQRLGAQEPPTFQLPEVTVPGRRPQPAGTTPASVTVLTREDLRRIGVLTVGEALAYVSELVIRQQGGLGALALPSIRGAAPNQVLVLIDGVPVNGPMTGVFDLSTVSSAQVERVEILKGPFSALYGSEALGGVINITTAEGDGSDVSARGGSLATTAVGARWTATGGSASISADRFASGGARPNSDVASLTVAGRLAWRQDNRSRMALRVHHFRSALGVPGPTAFPSMDARQAEVRTIMSARYDLDDAAGAWMVQGYYWTDAFSFTDPAFATDSRIDTQVGGVIVQRIWARSAGHLQTAGAEWKSLALVHNGAVGSRQSAIGALYVQDDRQITPRTLLSAGLRLDLHSIFGSQVTPRVGVVHVLSEDLVLRAALGRTARGPTFSELFFTPFNNPNLRPESAWSGDLGIVWRLRPGLELRTGAFLTEASDLIRPDTMFVPQNVGRATIAGGSLELAGQFGPRLTGNVALTALRAVDRATDAQLLRVPWGTASAALHYRAAEDLTVSGLLQVVGPRPDVDPATFSTVVLPAYAVVHLRISGTVSGGQWQVGVDNLFDAAYEPIAGFPAPGRSVFLAFTTRF